MQLPPKNASVNHGHKWVTNGNNLEINSTNTFNHTVSYVYFHLLLEMKAKCWCSF